MNQKILKDVQEAYWDGIFSAIVCIFQNNQIEDTYSV